jgi:hypothetical protein
MLGDISTLMLKLIISIIKKEVFSGSAGEESPPNYLVTATAGDDPKSEIGVGRGRGRPAFSGPGGEST